ncbi:hypothetical protein BDA99DRAFT_562242 [Phascolomyces articulosus]|uniref:Uncharacterized protein n=1 Tax=Phascolomyces articulosus TaxID=60185 RepID=A0AAD5JV56_9FUNG|nr:hypothetical protein BDA99DRAFT_562242 [Phascolomyces articulosus]
MLNIIKTLSILAIADVSLAAPTNSFGNDVTVTIKSFCSKYLRIYKLNNGHGGKKTSQDLSAGSSVDCKVDSNWDGRFWSCAGSSDCGSYGFAVSLAEFLFKGFER